jgi:hypothetical protein
MSQSLILIDALSSACWEKIKREMARFFFFLRAGKCGIFVAVRHN